jgi:type I restriction enzyme M protein
MLERLGQERGTLGLIFGKAQNKFQDPAKLRRLVVGLINAENWTILGADVKGDAYEGLLEKNAQDTKSGAGQYFTPRALIAAMVDCMAPQPGDTVCDPACGTAGFLFAAHDHVVAHHKNLTREQLKHLKEQAFTGYELVQSTARLAAMNLLLHGIGSEKAVPVVVGDALAADPGQRFDVVLANPPFGKKKQHGHRGGRRAHQHRKRHHRARRLSGHHQQQAAELCAAHQNAAQNPWPRSGGAARQRAGF